MTAVYEVQKAMKTLLTADSTLSAIIVGVYDSVPTNSDFPYLVFSDSTNTANNLFGHNVRDLTMTIHIFSRYEGFKEAYQIQDRLEAVLDHATLSLNTLHAVYCEYEFSTSLRDPDGITLHVPVRFRLKIE